MKLICFSFSEMGSKLGEFLTKLERYNIVHYRGGSSLDKGIKQAVKKRHGKNMMALYLYQLQALLQD